VLTFDYFESSADPGFRRENFGRIFSVRNPREMQFGVKLGF